MDVRALLSSPFAGTVLMEITKDVFAADRPFIWNGIDVGTIVEYCSCTLQAGPACSVPDTYTQNTGGRMAVLRLSGGDLLVHSPVALTSDLQAALGELGEVKYVVTPNTEHVKFAQQVDFKPRHCCALFFG